MGIFDFLGGPKKGTEVPDDKQEGNFPPIDDEGDTADGDELPEALTMEHDLAGYLKNHPEFKPKKQEDVDGQFE